MYFKDDLTPSFLSSKVQRHKHSIAKLVVSVSDTERTFIFWSQHSLLPELPNLEEQMPDNMPPMEDEELRDEWYCPYCRSSPCDFHQWEEELERIVNIMYPEVTNNQKRFHMYHHMAHKLHGHLGKGKRKSLPLCFQTRPEGFVPLRGGLHWVQAQPIREWAAWRSRPWWWWWEYL
jgi:rubredoxin